ncbi:histidine phosphatase family protein [Hoyosella sp. YIM 151337]|uniref:histidine phosphatase family protein n=1 Tax=Hoyosella sp. YIM 151337 TaxID=2992742 RepID=UPI00223658A2|nr:histidine phosphatase family protein [Hoyosella sp. YIM 151337]MCW4352702.1 histidine phosphatase family protein [Hoyosella sp. YIM 151337]
MGAIYLIRHGQASFGAENYDALSDLGGEQARATGAELRKRGAVFSNVASGTLLRQRDTARHAGYEPVADPRWNEYDFTDVIEHHGDPSAGYGDKASFQRILDDALARWITFRGPSPAAEAWSDFTARVDDAFSDLAREANSGRSVAAFTSGGVIAAIAARALGSRDHIFVPLHRVSSNGGITKLISGRSGISLVSYNEHGHLDDGRLFSYR